MVGDALDAITPTVRLVFVQKYSFEFLPSPTRYFLLVA